MSLYSNVTYGSLTHRDTARCPDSRTVVFIYSNVIQSIAWYYHGIMSINHAMSMVRGRPL